MSLSRIWSKIWQKMSCISKELLKIVSKKIVCKITWKRSAKEKRLWSDFIYYGKTWNGKKYAFANMYEYLFEIWYGKTFSIENLCGNFYVLAFFKAKVFKSVELCTRPCTRLHLNQLVATKTTELVADNWFKRSLIWSSTG